ncbi:hypothetical protein DPM33_15985 [Mesorhizobium hawassense]|uniref:Uncharacterized protein n=1 Tax=Mesorhizobium hawassense TaxID=1209954 RepID=A0A330HLZ8_9HYPH|nr:hypothetical protein DPM33_15985 [Mesorhizobium hawassense]
MGCKEAADIRKRRGQADVILAVFALYDTVFGDEISGLKPGPSADIEVAARQGLDEARADDPAILLAVAAFIAGDRIMVAGVPAMSDEECE